MLLNIHLRHAGRIGLILIFFLGLFCLCLVFSPRDNQALTEFPASRSIINYSELRKEDNSVLEEPLSEEIHFFKREGSNYCEATVLNGSRNRLNPLDRSENLVTFVSHASIHYFEMVQRLTERWLGPISIAFYLTRPEWEGKVLMEFLGALLHCNPSLQPRLSIQILLPNCSHLPLLQFIPKLGSSGTCKDLPILDPEDFENEDDTLTATYPFNVLRNLARSEAETPYVLVADIELQPSRNLDTHFAEFLEGLVEEEQVTEKDVFVVPVLEFEESLPYPDTKDEIRMLYNQRRAVFFHARFFPVGHKIPRPKEWVETLIDGDSQESDVYNAWVHASVKSLSPSWEPVYIGHKTVPLFAEQFIGYGYNKVQQVYELCRADYTFHILNGIFLSHRGIKVMHSNSEARDNVTRTNLKRYREFRSYLDRKYGPESRRSCDQFR